MVKLWLVSLLLTGVQLALAGFTMEEAFAIHPDGTPVNPEMMRDALRKGEYQGEELPLHWTDDDKLVELVNSGSLEDFVAHIQGINHQRMFAPDGSALDIAEWRQSVRDDKRYSELLKQSYPEEYELIMSGSDEEVQHMLRAAHSGATASGLVEHRDEL